MPASRRIAIVTSNYESAYPDPIKLETGEMVKTEKKETEWPGWIWCISQAGKVGWVPANYLILENGLYRVNRDYNAGELTVSIGERLQVLDSEAGWIWCEKANGLRGWVPLDHVRIEK